MSSKSLIKEIHKLIDKAANQKIKPLGLSEKEIEKKFFKESKEEKKQRKKKRFEEEKKKWWKEKSKLSKIIDVVDVASETIGIFSGVAGLFQDIASLTHPNPTTINNNIIDVKNTLATKPTLQQSVNSIKSIDDTLKNLEIKKINEWSNELTATFDEFRTNILSRDILNNILLDIQAFTDGITQKKEVMQKIYHQMVEILYSNYQDSLDIIENKKLPPITNMRDDDGTLHPIGNPTLAITLSCENEKDHEFIIYQTTPEIINKIKNIINFTGEEIDDFSGLTTYQFVLLYLQLIHIKRDENNAITKLDNILSAFYTDTEDICNLCSQE